MPIYVLSYLDFKSNSTYIKQCHEKNNASNRTGDGLVSC